MGNFFTVFMLTPWDSLNSNSLTEVKLFSLKNIIKTFPVIEPEFFDDILSNLYNFKHYSWIECIRRIIGPNDEDYDITPWNFLWGVDNDRRMFQMLFQKVKKEIKDSQATLVALAPPELGKLLKLHKEKALLRTLSLLNDPKKMKFVMILAPKGKSLTEEQQLLHINKNYLDKNKINKSLKQMPNIKGQWFPEYSPRCPNCNKLITEIRGFNVGLLKFRCPYCGHQKG
ncbi:MAG TPA: hypothetical protein ENH98_01005 [archaeon]|nr:hypothetical protein [archaeon]